MKDKMFPIICITVGVLCVIVVICLASSVFATRDQQQQTEQTQTQDMLVNKFETTYATLYDGYVDKVSRNTVVDNNQPITEQTNGEVAEVVVETKEQTTVEELAKKLAVDASQISQVNDNVFVYTIQSGDTLSGISEKLGVSVDELANKNEIRNVNLIYMGSALKIR